MCGIVGLISKKAGGFWHADVEMFKHLLVIDGEMRGLDSTGAMSIGSRTNGEVKIVKVGSHPHHLFETTEWDEFRQHALQQGRILIGHNRSATKGSITSANAHPFHEEGIILVHNGTLRGDHKKLGDKEVDSHALCHAFSQQGAEEVIPTIDGAFALVWWDVKKQSLFAIRNDERPLSLVVTTDMIAIASEPWMAISQFHREKKKVEETIHCVSGLLYEFKIGGGYTTKTVKLREDDYVTRYYGSGQNYTDMENHTCVVRPFPKKPLANVLGYKHPDYTADELVAIKITAATFDDKEKRVRVQGFTCHPGKPKIDVIGYLDDSVKMSEIPSWYEEPTVAKIGTMSSSNCGPSAFVYDIDIVDPVTVYNNRDISKLAWFAAVNDCTCSECKGFIGGSENLVTHVSFSKEGEVKIICADCIAEKLHGKFKDDFIQRRNTALQSAEPVRKGSGESFIAIGNAPSTATVQ